MSSSLSLIWLYPFRSSLENTRAPCSLSHNSLITGIKKTIRHRNLVKRLIVDKNLQLPSFSSPTKSDSRKDCDLAIWFLQSSLIFQFHSFEHTSIDKSLHSLELHLVVRKWHGPVFVTVGVCWVVQKYCDDYFNNPLIELCISTTVSSGSTPKLSNSSKILCSISLKVLTNDFNVTWVLPKLGSPCNTTILPQP